MWIYPFPISATPFFTIWHPWYNFKSFRSTSITSWLHKCHYITSLREKLHRQENCWDLFSVRLWLVILIISLINNNEKTLNNSRYKFKVRLFFKLFLERPGSFLPSPYPPFVYMASSGGKIVGEYLMKNILIITNIKDVICKLHYVITGESSDLTEVIECESPNTIRYTIMEKKNRVYFLKIRALRISTCIIIC